jgi:hypothetical protein
VDVVVTGSAPVSSSGPTPSDVPSPDDADSDEEVSPEMLAMRELGATVIGEIEQG